jgi:hypothetical protein
MDFGTQLVRHRGDDREAAYAFARGRTGTRQRRYRNGLVVTEVSKVPIWKAFSINGLRHGVRSNLLIL